MKEENRGDGPCEKCESYDNPVWYTGNEFWNEIVGKNGLLCLRCFMDMAHEKKDIIRWRITADIK